MNNPPQAGDRSSGEAVRAPGRSQEPGSGARTIASRGVQVRDSPPAVRARLDPRRRPAIPPWIASPSPPRPASTGQTLWLALGLLVLAVALLVAELFVVSFGILLVGSIASAAGAIHYAFVASDATGWAMAVVVPILAVGARALGARAHPKITHARCPRERSPPKQAIITTPRRSACIPARPGSWSPRRGRRGGRASTAGSATCRYRAGASGAARGWWCCATTVPSCSSSRPRTANHNTTIHEFMTRGGNTA